MTLGEKTVVCTKCGAFTARYTPANVCAYCHLGVKRDEKVIPSSNPNFEGGSYSFYTNRVEVKKV